MTTVNLSTLLLVLFLLGCGTAPAPKPAPQKIGIFDNLDSIAPIEPSYDTLNSYDTLKLMDISDTITFTKGFMDSLNPVQKIQLYNHLMGDYSNSNTSHLKGLVKEIWNIDSCGNKTEGRYYTEKFYFKVIFIPNNRIIEAYTDTTYRIYFFYPADSRNDQSCNNTTYNIEHEDHGRGDKLPNLTFEDILARPESKLSQYTRGCDSSYDVITLDSLGRIKTNESSGYGDGSTETYSYKDKTLNHDPSLPTIEAPDDFLPTQMSYESGDHGDVYKYTEIYHYLEFDRYGNWVKRLVTDTLRNSYSEWDEGDHEVDTTYSKKRLERREIEYFKVNL